MSEQKSKVFETELSFIKKQWLRGLVATLLDDYVPDYFYEVAASSTGRYHPEYCLGPGGLVRHTKAAVQIARDLLDNPMYRDSVGDLSDEIISALILHDSVKHGKDGGRYSKFEHPLLVKSLFDEAILDDVVPDVEDAAETIEIIVGLIQSHMGPWTTNKHSRIRLPLPHTGGQEFVHLCDYLASRKKITICLDD